jgi:hypothetical protein
MVLALHEGRCLAFEFVCSISMESMIISIFQPTDAIKLALTPLAIIQNNTAQES